MSNPTHIKEILPAVLRKIAEVISDRYPETTAENRRRIDEFLEKIGEGMPWDALNYDQRPRNRPSVKSLIKRQPTKRRD